MSLWAVLLSRTYTIQAIQSIHILVSKCTQQGLQNKFRASYQDTEMLQLVRENISRQQN